jgi:hypothetical protein
MSVFYHGLSNFRNQPPVPTESSSVPPDHCFWSDQKESLLPSGPEPVRYNPEGFIEYCEPWPGMSSLQRCKLLAKSQVLKKQIAPSAEHAPNRSEQKRKQVHHVMLLSHFPCGREGRILLKSRQNRVLGKDRHQSGPRRDQRVGTGLRKERGSRSHSSRFRLTSKLSVIALPCARDCEP